MDKATWRIKGIFNADAQKVADEIGDNKFNYREILEKARDKDTELHKCFEWNDGIAAEKYRLEQAKKIVTMLVFTPQTKQEQPLRVYQITQEKNVYQPTRMFLENKSEYNALLNRALKELESFQRRYRSLSELEDIMEQIDTLIK